MLLATYAPATLTAHDSRGRFVADVTTVVHHPSCLVLAFRSLHIRARSSRSPFGLPLLLTSAHSVSLGAAGLLSALVLAVSAIGHVSSGYLLRAGAPVWVNLAAAFGCFALSGFAIYGGALPPLGFRSPPRLRSESAALRRARSMSPPRTPPPVHRRCLRRSDWYSRPAISASLRVRWCSGCGSSISAGMPRRLSWRRQPWSDSPAHSCSGASSS